MLAKRPNAVFKLRRRFDVLTMLHGSLLLFLAGVLIYLFHFSHGAFLCVLAWVPNFTLHYTVFTVLPAFQPTNLFYTPFTPMVFYAYLIFLYATSRVWPLIAPLRNLSDAARVRYDDLSHRYKGGFTEGRTKSIEKAASKPSPEIETEVLERMLLVLDNDHALEEFFDTVPGFCDSRMVHKPLDLRVTTRLQKSLDAFLDRTFSSHLVTESVRNNRLITCLNAAHSALGPNGVSQILGNFFNGYRDDALKIR